MRKNIVILLAVVCVICACSTGCAAKVDNGNPNISDSSTSNYVSEDEVKQALVGSWGYFSKNLGYLNYFSFNDDGNYYSGMFWDDDGTQKYERKNGNVAMNLGYGWYSIDTENHCITLHEGQLDELSPSSTKSFVYNLNYEVNDGNIHFEIPDIVTDNYCYFNDFFKDEAFTQMYGDITLNKKSNLSINSLINSYPQYCY